MSDTDGKYIYCIIQSTAPQVFSAQPIAHTNSERVYTVHYDDLAAVLSDAPIKRYDVSRQNTLAHEKVIEEVMQRGFTVLPVRFGTVAQSINQIRERLLKRRFGLLHGYLYRVQGKVELGLKAFWNKEQMFREIAAEDMQIQRLRDLLAATPPAQGYADRIELGRMVEAALIAKRDAAAEKVLETLRPLADELRVNQTLTDAMIVNAAFLVCCTVESEFDAAVNRLDEQYAGRVTFKYVGPVPPFNFVNIVVNWNEE
ncbi:MAG: GvpL/GvpF family gas vesicle protein [Chloroflexi bacterium]|nr:GvpL/GvpF family gas vesicle protein [Chloroflexota bacterium]